MFVDYCYIDSNNPKGLTYGNARVSISAKKLILDRQHKENPAADDLLFHYAHKCRSSNNRLKLKTLLCSIS